MGVSKHTLCEKVVWRRSVEGYLTSVYLGIERSILGGEGGVTEREKDEEYKCTQENRRG